MKGTGPALETTKEIQEVLNPLPLDTQKNTKSLHQLLVEVNEGNYTEFQGYVALHSKLDLESSCLFPKVDMTRLADALRGTSFKELNLNRNKITDADMDALAPIFQNNNDLTALKLAFNLLTSKGAATLANAIKGNRTISVLDLRANNLGNEGVKALAPAIQENGNITFLSLARNSIDAEGIKALAPAIKENRKL